MAEVPFVNLPREECHWTLLMSEITNGLNVPVLLLHSNAVASFTESNIHTTLCYMEYHSQLTRFHVFSHMTDFILGAKSIS